MNKPHKHAKLIKAWADGAQIQYKNLNEWEDCVIYPKWDNNTEYRIKPEPKHDIVYYGKAGIGEDYDIYLTRFILAPLDSFNLKLTFDGEAGKLKKAEVLE